LVPGVKKDRPYESSHDLVNEALNPVNHVPYGNLN